MNEEEKEKLVKANSYFAVECFNQIWALMEKPDKEAKDLETMIHLAHTSFWHWTQHPTVQSSNIAVGYWMLSRVYAVTNNAIQSLLYAQKCLETSQVNSLQAFSFGYAYEAFARAYRLNGNLDKMNESLDRGFEYAEKITEEDDKQYLISDLQEIRGY